MAEAIWNGNPPDTARTQISICVSRLRKAFKESGYGHEIIRTANPGYVLAPGPYRIDAVEFEEKSELAQEQLRRHRTDDALRLMREALDLWRGPVLSGMSEQSLGADMRRLEEKRQSIREELAELRLERGEYRQLIPELTAALHDHPLREATRAALMLALYQAGRSSESTDLFRDAYRMSIEEFGIAPGHKLQEMHQAILRDDPALLRYRGAPEHLPEGTAVVRVPLDVPCFTGREEEIAELDRLLEPAFGGESLRLGVITGGPGVGKSALAARWAHQSASAFPDGRLFVGLGQSRNGEPAEALAQVLRTLEGPTADVDEPFDGLALRYQETIAGKRLLLIFDDVRDIAQLEPLLPLSNSCCVLVTTTAALEIQTPTFLPLTPLDTDRGVEYLDRMVSGDRVRSDPGGAARLVSLCDGLPLALSCAAARLRAKPHWNLRRLLARLEDPRHRLDELRLGTADLRARFDSGYAGLAPAAAALYRRLPLLQDATIDLDTASALLNADQVTAEEVLEQLVDVHLLAASPEPHGDPLYKLSHLLEAHAQERLRSDEAPDERHKAQERLETVLARRRVPTGPGPRETVPPNGWRR